jgi:ABC transport system ATP-binding/permease protein
VHTPKKLSFKEKKEFESLPAHIAALEAEQARLQRESASPEFYKEGAAHIKGVLARIDAIAKELETALARWIELDERNR